MRINTTSSITQLNNGSCYKLCVMKGVVSQSASVAYFLIVTRTNYPDRVILMKVYLSAQVKWDVIEDGQREYRKDRRAMSLLLRAVALELVCTLGAKKTVKEACDTFKIITIIFERAREGR